MKLIFGDVKKFLKWTSKHTFVRLYNYIKSKGLPSKFMEKIFRPFTGFFSRMGESVVEMVIKGRSRLANLVMNNKFVTGLISSTKNIIANVTETASKALLKLTSLKNIFSGGAGAGGLFSRILSPIKNLVGEFAERFLSKNLVQKFLKLGGGILKRIPGLQVLFAGWDAIQGWKDAAEITGDSNPGFLKKFGASMAGIMSGITFGIVSPKTIYNGFGKVFDMIKDGVLAIKDWFMNTAPVKMVTEFLGLSGEDKEGEEEPSFISKIWLKFKEIGADAFNYICGIPVIGLPFSIMRDAYDLLFGEKTDEEGNVKKSFFGQLIDDFKNLTVDEFLTKLLGPIYTTAKDIYQTIFGNEKVKAALGAVGKGAAWVGGKISEGVGWGLNKLGNAFEGTKTGESIKSTGKFLSNVKEKGGQLIDSIFKPSQPSQDFLGYSNSKVGTEAGGKIKLGSFTISPDIYNAILNASSKYGVPKEYLFATAAAESGFKVSKAGTSSARGIFQFVDGTWTEYWKPPYPSRDDPNASADAGARYTLQTMNKLGTTDPTKLYLGHFLGRGGAAKFLEVLKTNPNAPIESVVSAKQIRDNPGVFAKLNIRTVGELYNWAQDKMATNFAAVGLGSLYASKGSVPTTGEGVAIASSGVTPSINSSIPGMINQASTQTSGTPVRDQSTVQNVGAMPNLKKDIAESRTPTVDTTQPQYVAGNQSSPTPPPATPFVYAPTIASASDESKKHTFEKDLGILNDILDANLFGSLLAFKNEVGKSFVFGDNLSALAV